MVSLKPARITLCIGLLASAHFAGAQLGVFSNAHAQDAAAAVSYTHLTLPTIYSV